MARIQRYNVILDVADSEVGYYLNLGYSLLDNQGNVVKKAMSTDVRTLQKELTDANKLIVQLKAENEKLTNEIAELKSASSVADKAPTKRKKAAE